METLVIIAVPQRDAVELDELDRALGRTTPKSNSRALDGQTLVQAITAISLATLPVVRTWILARADHRKATTVAWGGNTLVGYSKDEVTEILDALDRTLHSDEPETSAEPDGDVRE